MARLGLSFIEWWTNQSPHRRRQASHNQPGQTYRENPEKQPGNP
jgi:hypothetical protein